MLVIRKAQMDVFEKQAELEFERKMLGYVQNDFPGKFAEMGEAGTLEYIRGSVVSAAGIGLDSHVAIGLFITLKLEFGESFERSPDRVWAQNMLHNPNLPSDTRAIEVAKKLIGGANGQRIVVEHAIP